MPPRERHFRPAVTENDWWSVGRGPGLIEAHPDAVGVGKLQRRHFDHGGPRSAGGAFEIARWRIGGLQRCEFARQHVAKLLDMGNDVGAGDEAEVELVAVAL